MHPSISHILKFFAYEHLPPKLQETSKPFHDLAHKVADSAKEADNPEITVALRKLLEAKDAAVRAVLSVALFLTIALTAGAQPLQAPPVRPPQAPSVVDVEEMLYVFAQRQAVAEGKPIVRFIGVNARSIEGCVVAKLRGYNDNRTPRIIVSRVDSLEGLWLPPDATDQHIRRAAGLEVGQRAAPFSSKAAAPTADGSPWLSRAESDAILAMMPKGVPVSKGLKFYKLRPVYQNMYTMNNGQTRINEITTREDAPPWRDSGGMHHVNKSQWRNVTGLDLPGKITYWQEDTDVRAFALVPKWRWSFPRGTLAYDVLLRVKDGKEHVFEVRVQEKLDDRWDDGTVYRPKVNLDGAEKHWWTWGFANEGLEAQSPVYTARIDPRAEFAPSRKVVVDDDFTPRGYVGTGMSCNTCHSRVGQIYDVPGQIYREARRGDDGRFSWHPFDESGNLDVRWPIQPKK